MSDKERIERKFEKGTIKFFYNDWIKNFALNLENIWMDHSARELYPNKKLLKSSAIVIGRGPSIKKHHHLELLAQSDFKGTIVCTDGALSQALKAGVTPKKFPKFYVITVDSTLKQIDFYKDPLCKKFGNKIRCILSTTVPLELYRQVRKNKMSVYWVHALFDYDVGKKSFNYIADVMVKAKKHEKGIPAIQTGGNVGTAAWIVSWSILKCSHVALIGIDHGYNKETPWEETLHSFFHNPNNVNQKDVFKRAYPTVYNPDFDCYCKQDPVFLYYSNALKEFIQRTQKTVKTINATEGGAIFGEGIKSMMLKDFLKKYKI